MSIERMRSNFNLLYTIMSKDTYTPVNKKKSKALRLIHKLRLDVNNMPHKYIQRIINYCDFFLMTYKKKTGHYSAWLGLRIFYSNQLALSDDNATSRKKLRPKLPRKLQRPSIPIRHKIPSSAHIEELINSIERKIAPKFNKICKSIW